MTDLLHLFITPKPTLIFIPVMQRFRGFLTAPFSVFSACWILLFLIYLPAANAGWISDTLGWLDAVRHQSFTQYVNRGGMGVTAFYQTTQTVTWLLFQVFGVNKWAWHIVHLSLQALNAVLLFSIIRRIAADSGFARGDETGWLAALLFCTAPQLSEVIVWEGSFHYLQSIAFQLTVVLLMLRWLRRQHGRDLVFSLVIMLAAAGSLELFYLTPVIMMLVLGYYAFVLRWDRQKVKRTVYAMLLPQAGIIIVHLLLARLVFGTVTARMGNAMLHLPPGAYAVKPPMLLFHLLGGRFLPQAARDAVYAAFCTYAGAGIFYAALCAIIVIIVVRFRRMNPVAVLSALAFLWMLAAILLITPMWLPTRLIILGDRYLYVVLPPAFLLLALSIMRIRGRWIRWTISGVVILLQCAGTWYESRLWQRSDRMTQSLAQSFAPPDDPTKIVLLLNNPHSLRGALMVGAGRAGELALLRKLFYGSATHAKVYEVAAPDLDDETDVPFIQCTHDSMIAVSFKAGKSRWWLSSDYLHDYTTPDYTLLLDRNNYAGYTLHLKGDVHRFLLMYAAGAHWYLLDSAGKKAKQ